MAPFNHFGTDFTNPLPPISPPSTKRSARPRRLLRDMLPERVPHTTRDPKLSPSDQFDAKRSKFSRNISTDKQSQRSRHRRAVVESDSEDSVGVSGSDSDDAPGVNKKEILGDAITGVGSVVHSALHSFLDGQSSTAVAAPEKSSAAGITSKPADVATTASEPPAVAITSSKPSSAAEETSKPAAVATSAEEQQPSQLPGAPSSSGSSVVELQGTSGVLSQEAAATPTPSKVASLTRFTPEFTMAFPTPTAQLQSTGRVSLGNSQATGAAGQKAQGQSIDSTVTPEPDSDSDSGVDSGVESDDDLESDDEDEHTESRLVAFTTISGTPLSTLSAVLDPTAVGALPNRVTPVSQTGGQTTVASASANKPPLTPEASNGLIAFGAVGKDDAIQFITSANMV